MTGRDGIARVGIAVQAGKPMTAQGNTGARLLRGPRFREAWQGYKQHEANQSARYSHWADPVHRGNPGCPGFGHRGGVGRVQ